MMHLIKDCQNKISALSKRIQLVFTTGRTSGHVNDSGVIRTVQVLLGPKQVRDNTKIIQHYGFASNMPPNGDVAILAINGDRNVPVIIGTNHQSYTIENLGNGSVALYDMFGNTIVLSSTGMEMKDLSNNIIAMTSSGVKITSPIAFEVDAPNIRHHATTSLKQDAGGTGQTVEPGSIINYTLGITPTTVAPDPPEIP